MDFLHLEIEIGFSGNSRFEKHLAPRRGHEAGGIKNRCAAKRHGGFVSRDRRRFRSNASEATFRFWIPHRLLLLVLVHAAALLVLLAAAAGTGIIGINLCFLYDGGRTLLLFVEFLSGFFIEDVVPLFQPYSQSASAATMFL